VPLQAVSSERYLEHGHDAERLAGFGLRRRTRGEFELKALQLAVCRRSRKPLRELWPKPRRELNQRLLAEASCCRSIHATQA
jgi:hypothetical protein